MPLTLNIHHIKYTFDRTLSPLKISGYPLPFGCVGWCKIYHVGKTCGNTIQELLVRQHAAVLRQLLYFPWCYSLKVFIL